MPLQMASVFKDRRSLFWGWFSVHPNTTAPWRPNPDAMAMTLRKPRLGPERRGALGILADAPRGLISLVLHRWSPCGATFENNAYRKLAGDGRCLRLGARYLPRWLIDRAEAVSGLVTAA